MTPTESDDDPVDNYEDAPQLHARTSTQGDGTMACTIYPADSSDEERITRWITAEEGSYVDLAGLR